MKLNSFIGGLFLSVLAFFGLQRTPTKPLGIVVNPTVITSSTISSSGAVLGANNGKDFASTSTTLSNLGGVGFAGSSTANNIPYWLDANGNLSSSSYLSQNSTTPLMVNVTNQYSTSTAGIYPQSSSSLGVDNNGIPQSYGVGLQTVAQESPFWTNYVNASSVITTFQPGNGWVAVGSTTLAADTSNYIKGNQSLSISTVNLGGLSSAESPNSGAVYNFTGKYLELYLYVASSSQISELQVKLSSNNSFSGGAGSFIQWDLDQLEQGDHNGDYFPSGQWQRVILPFASASSSAIIINSSTFNPAAVNRMEISVEDKGVATTTVEVNQIAMVQAAAKPVVIFTFDDSLTSAYSLGLPILSQAGYAADIFDIPQRQFGIGVGGLSYMTVPQMQTLQNTDGWDIDCHTYDHPNGTGIATYSVASDTYEFSACKTFDLANGFYSGVNLLAWPEGDRSNTSTQVAQAYFSVSRGANDNIPETNPPANPFYLRAYEFASSTSAAADTSTLASFLSGNPVIIIELHAITSSTPVLATDMSTSTLQAIVNYLQSQNVTVETLSQFVNGSTAPTLQTDASSTPNTLAAFSAGGNITSVNANTTIAFSSNIGFATSSVAVSSCGTGSPTITGSNNVGTILSGTSASSCTVTFATPTFKNPPVCTISDSNTTAVTDVSSVSSSSVTFSMASALSGVNLYYTCWGNPN